MNPYAADSSANFRLSCFTIDEGCGVKPEMIWSALGEKNIESRSLWKPMHMQPVFKGREFVTAPDSKNEMGVSTDLFARRLCLPSDIKMSEDEQGRVISFLKQAF